MIMFEKLEGLSMSQSILRYAEQHYLHESAALAALRQYALEHEYAHKMSPPLQVQMLQSFLQMMQASHVIEVGCFLGYSTLAFAEAIPKDGRVIACERRAQWIEQGRPFWQQAGLDHKIDVRLGDAQVTLQTLLHQGCQHSFDFIYIDADKQHYIQYLDLGLKLLSPAGVIAFDNTFSVHHGNVSDPQTPTTKSLHLFNQYLSDRKDLKTTMLPMFEGLVLVHR